MPNTTTIRVARATRDELRLLADADGVTLDDAVARLVRRERQRRIGLALAEPLSIDDEAWVDASARSVRDALG